MGVYVVRTSSLNDEHSCQLFRKASSVVLLSSSVYTVNLRCLLATKSWVSLQPLLTSIFESGQALFLVSLRLIFNPQPFFPLFRLWSSVYCEFHISSERFLFVMIKLL